MKKLLSLLLCLAMVVCFCACGGDSSSDTQNADTTTPVTAAPTTEAETEAETETETEVTSADAETTAAGTTKVNTTAASTTKKSTTAKTTAKATEKQPTNKGNSGSSKTTAPATVTKVISAATSTFATVPNIFSPLDGKTPIVITNPNTAPATTVPAPGGAPSVTAPGGVANTTTGGVANTTQGVVPGTTSGGSSNVPATTVVQNTTIPPAVSKNSVITYPRAEGLTLASEYSLTANDVAIDLYSISVNNNHSFSSNPKLSTAPVGMFEMTGPVTLNLTVPTAATSAVVRPVGKGVVPTVSGTTVTFTVTEPGYYSVELDGDEKNAVILFIDEPHVAPTGNVTVKAAGLYENVNITVEDGETLYLAPGAVIQGKILLKSNAKVCGRGIIDGSCYTSWLDSYARLPIELWESTNTSVEEIFILNPNAWALQIQNSSNITVDNVKVITSRPNGDGFSLQSSHDVEITNCFLRTWDDTLVVKNYGLPASYNISFKDCVLWNDLAQSMEIGYETNKAGNPNPVIHDILFENITVIHGCDGAVVSIHNSDNAEIYDINYKNIVVEHFKTFKFIDMNNNISGNWSNVKDDRGTIHDVTVDGLTLLDGRFGGTIDATEGAISNVKLMNLNFLGKKITTAADAKLTLEGNPGVTIS